MTLGCDVEDDPGCECAGQLTSPPEGLAILAPALPPLPSSHGGYHEST